MVLHLTAVPTLPIKRKRVVKVVNVVEVVESRMWLAMYLTSYTVVSGCVRAGGCELMLRRMFVEVVSSVSS